MQNNLHEKPDHDPSSSSSSSQTVSPSPTQLLAHLCHIKAEKQGGGGGGGFKSSKQLHRRFWIIP